MRLLCVLALLSGLSAVVDSQRVDLPTCYSTSEDYMDTQLIVEVQPFSPVLVRRFQAPEIRIFCVEFEEAGASCGQVSLPVLCSRPVSDPNAAFSCERLDVYGADANADVTRGSINGQDMIWDLMWDGTTKAADCYPRAVRFRALALVRGKDVSSVAVFVVLLLIVIVAVLAIALVLIWFVYNRLQQIDDAGAVTIAGPKSTFQGPQMAVGPSGGIVGVDKVYLPVNENGATVEDQSAGAAKFGLTAGDHQRGNLPATPASRVRRGAKRPSPPKPGDGLPGGVGQFRGAQRTVFGAGESGADEDEEDPYFYDEEGLRRYRHDGSVAPPGTSIRRRRGGRGGRRGARRDPGDEELQAMGYASLFPTENGWKMGEADETFVDEDGNELDPEEARRRGMAAPKFAPDLRGRVRYIPQWQHGTFAKGGHIPELGDGELDQDYVQRDLSGREVGKETPRARTFGRYTSSRASGLMRRSPTGGDDAGGYQSGGSGAGRRRASAAAAGRRSPFAADRGGDSAIRRDRDGHPIDEPNGTGELADRQRDSFGGARYGAQRRRPSNGPAEGRTFNSDGGLAEAGNDNFNRSRAKLFSPGLDAMAHGPDAATRRSGLRGRGGKENVGGNENTTGAAPAPPPVLQCQHCKVIFTGVNDPPFCVATGERHF
jgi:hypothetical protein